MIAYKQSQYIATYLSMQELCFTQAIKVKHATPDSRGFFLYWCHSAHDVFSCTHISRDPCFPAHISLTTYQTTSHSDSYMLPG